MFTWDMEQHQALKVIARDLDRLDSGAPERARKLRAHYARAFEIIDRADRWSRKEERCVNTLSEALSREMLTAESPRRRVSF
jgi:hypothetical protein